MIRIGIIESNYILSRNYADFFEGMDGYNISFQVASLKDFYHQPQQLQRTNVVLLDIASPDGLGMEAISFIRKHAPEIKIVIFTSKKDTSVVVEALRNGADSFLLKTEGLFELHKAIKETLQDGLVLSPSAARMFVKYIFANGTPVLPLDFTNKEHEIIKLVQQGLSYKEMASRLKVTSFTINHHLKKIYKKGGVNSRSQLMVLLQQQAISA